MSQEFEPPLIGAQMNVLLQVIADRVLVEVRHAGFTDVRPTHLSVLRNLGPTGRRISELALAVGITKASIVYLIDHLEERRYVERVADSRDGRAILVQLSERGWALHQVARGAIQRVQQEWTETVGQDEMETVLATLARLVSHVTEAEGAMQVSKPRPARGRRHTGL